VAHYHTESTDSSIVLVMELCNYNDLESYYNKHAPLNESDMNIILIQLASGLQLLYSKKIIHRDLKPEVSSRAKTSFNMPILEHTFT
jgi:serine/threonine protein kinase